MTISDYRRGNDKYCQICGEWKMEVFSPHRCHPIWLVIDCDYFDGDINDLDDDDFKKIRAMDEEEAAKEYAEITDDEGPQEREVIVKRKDGTMALFSITYEHTVVYSAHSEGEYGVKDEPEGEEEIED